ncbi:UDP-N-acetyl-D-mannosamine dehydrogenase [Corallincola spongiicola]|uniref:UDP-N-acetyl-D-mannosamine dehydrogenase n=1 Tax=Corallincola spongiicola TaxID=2520508 RepID=A0ABY1WK72_9GAMM|nr:UDP-N-acetyl-D-mannosamine dehydrogenase [Corallincola spongiicola]TAA39583.1 UDP-N-acetyl-D-mannosamine dehydrogenase [Corallincola spongiicola]
MSFETISVIGLGYIGLPTAAMFASRKKKVVGVDVDTLAVETINRGEIHIVEPDLDMLVSAAVQQGHLKAVTTPEPADAFLIAVPTPFKSSSEEGIPEPDLSYIQAAAAAIAPVLKKGDLVILESTSPVGTTELLAEWLAEHRSDFTFPHQVGETADINVAHCPERVLPGKVVTELVQNDRVIGGITKRCSERSVELYRTFVMGECVVTNARTAEMAKLTENSSRDVQIAFANELSMICDDLDINVWELIALANRHPRVDILQPGPGVGGHCIAVDPWFIVSKTPSKAALIHTARKVNDLKPEWVIDKVKIAIADFLQDNPERTVQDITIACYGLTFKPDIDDLRESPALNIAKTIASDHAGEVLAIEPNVEKINVDRLKLATIDESLCKTDIHVMLVDHTQFKKIRINDSYVIDTKGIW